MCIRDRVVTLRLATEMVVTLPPLAAATDTATNAHHRRRLDVEIPDVVLQHGKVRVFG